MQKFKTIFFVWMILCGFTLEKHAYAQEVSIPDPGLELAIRSALNKPVGSLTEQDLVGLTELNASGRGITQLHGLEKASHLRSLNLRSNHLTDLSFPSGMDLLESIDLSFNPLGRCSFPEGLNHLLGLTIENAELTNLTISTTMTNLRGAVLFGNRLTNFELPTGLHQLAFLDLSGNQMTNLKLPSGLTGLAQLELELNQLSTLTLPSDMTSLTGLTIDSNPLTALVVSESLAATRLSTVLAALESKGVNILKYPLTVQLVNLGQGPGSFRFGITGPPGFYHVLRSFDLVSWTSLNMVDNPLGGIYFADTTAQLASQKFYRAQSVVTPPANLVFVPGQTFLMGSPTNEVGHRADEGPQMIVTLSRSFWMSKYLVTQGEYLAVTGSNPSQFPGDLSRPVESVSWFAASNYCALLTQKELAEGRIPTGSHYRLPTEAEWECVARAGTTNRFFYGDDPNLTHLTNYAWYGANSGFTTHPVGQKLPNPWGLYDMMGNVWEWCLDWYGPYPGGLATDPQGPASNAIGFKVIRGSAWESSEFDCRSARRSIEAASPFISDFIIGFRVVLAMDP